MRMFYNADPYDVIKDLEENSVDLMFVEASKLYKQNWYVDYYRVLKEEGVIVFFRSRDGEKEILDIIRNENGKTIIIVSPSNRDVRNIIDKYSNEGDMVLDTNIGSGEVGSYCVKKNRGYIGIKENFDTFDQG